MLRENQDAFGNAYLDYINGDRGTNITIDRDDGLTESDLGCGVYFSEFEQWSPLLREAVGQVRGRVLDVGCGVGRHSLYLQSKGHEVLGIDESPLAVEICKQRGVENALALGLTQVSSKLGKFDSIIMFGNNFGLVSNPTRARWLLRRLRSITSPGARILAETLDPYQTTNHSHLAYHERNRKRGRLGGQARIRVRYKQFKTSWFDLLLASKAELEAIVEGTGWRVAGFIDSAGPGYVAVIEKS